MFFASLHKDIGLDVNLWLEAEIDIGMEGGLNKRLLYIFVSLIYCILFLLSLNPSFPLVKGNWAVDNEDSTVYELILLAYCQM